MRVKPNFLIMVLESEGLVEGDIPSASCEIFDNTGTIRITYNGFVKHIAKPAIVEVSVLRGKVIKIQTGNVLETVYIDYADVASPVSFSVDHLRSLINQMLHCLCCGCDGGITD